MTKIYVLVCDVLRHYISGRAEDFIRQKTKRRPNESNVRFFSNLCVSTFTMRPHMPCKHLTPAAVEKPKDKKKKHENYAKQWICRCIRRRRSAIVLACIGTRILSCVLRLEQINKNSMKKRKKDRKQLKKMKGKRS